MNQKEIENVFKLEPIKRYEYFIKKIADFEEVWALRHNDGWASASDELGNLYIPFWPKKEFARLCAENEWEDYCAECIPLDEFIESWISGMAKDKVMASIFPNFFDQNVVIQPEKLLEHLKEELKFYE